MSRERPEQGETIIVESIKTTGSTIPPLRHEIYTASYSYIGSPATTDRSILWWVFGLSLCFRNVFRDSARGIIFNYLWTHLFELYAV